ncbi:MAG: TIGR00730 family Rossman fold protein [Flavobacteriaceae bacterium]|nr:TIGR00730 family Rossman fold protein [Flavobacteriaceae bacterium]
MQHLVVFCGSNPGNDPEYGAQAFALGKQLALTGIGLVYGGGKVGLMGKVAEGSLQHGGKVLGVIPDFLKRKEVHHEGLQELIVVKSMHERKLLMHERSDGIVMLPGGFGTFEEFFEMLTWAQLGLHQKPIGILNTSGFFNELLVLFDQMVAKGFVKKVHKSMIIVSDEPEELLAKMQDYRPQHTDKWMNKTQL